ncbi:uncharacterized protein DS421_9g277280 [Arachis hypogaea]|nr:uncharacterized protein DS421_9g277280 [Arachis hypogaea]
MEPFNQDVPIVHIVSPEDKFFLKVCTLLIKFLSIISNVILKKKNIFSSF